MDLVLKLREVRRIRGLSQKDVARLSGVHEKTISSFETGQRIDSLKISQLRRILRVYGLSEAQFFGAEVQRLVAPWEASATPDPADVLPLHTLFESICRMPAKAQTAVVDALTLIVSGVLRTGAQTTERRT
jgi:transcriptional regulator with XRE-family HTH domain